MTETLIPKPDTTLWTAQSQGHTVLPGSDQAIVVPSGQGVTLHDVIVDAPSPDTAIYRFRYLAPAIARDGGTMNFETSIADMQHLCESYALPRLTAPLPAKLEVIISFADLPVPFGETNPQATQFFVAFTIKDSLCILEPF
jgi:Family of unknown function (DUF6497)